MGGEKVVLEDSKEADKTTGRATHRISKGIHDKGHSVTRKLGTDGKVDTMQTLHNLNEGVQRRLEMNRQDGVNDKTNKNSVRQPKYQPPMKNNQRGMYMGKGRGIGDTTEKLGNMTIGNGRGPAPSQPHRQHQMHPPPMKAGVANGRSADFFTGRSQSFSNKVAG